MTLQEVAGLQIRSTMFLSNDIPPLLARNVACQLRRLFDPFCPLKGARPKPVRTDAISADTAWSCNPANWACGRSRQNSGSGSRSNLQRVLRCRGRQS